MFFGRKSLGFEIRPAGISAVLLSGTSESPQLERVAFSPLPRGAVRSSLREQNVLDADSFITAVRAAHNLLLHNGTRISLSLPDTVGRVMLLDVEGRFKSRAEALDVIRWKLKKNIPFEIADTHLDYQQLMVRENGDLALMVALVSRGVIGQYEELLLKAGLTPVRIDFNSFNLCRAFDRRLTLHDDMAFISFYDSTLSIQVYGDGVLEFQRIKDLPGSSGVDSRVYMEIDSSLMVYRDRCPERVVQHISCSCAPEAADGFSEMISEATGYTPVQLEVKAVIKPGDSAPADQETLFPYTAAIGAAMRNI